MTWEATSIISGWVATILAGVFALGKQTRKLEELEERIDECQDTHEENNELKVKLAVVEADVKSLLREVSDFKTLLLNKIVST